MDSFPTPFDLVCAISSPPDAANAPTFENASLHVLGDKYTPGAGEVDGTIGLRDLLVEQFPVDAHFTMYTHPSATRLVKGPSYPGIRFDLAVLDLDFDNHATRPDADDFCRHVSEAYMTDHVPNVVYQTRGGVRWIYVIAPVSDAELFERHYQSLIKKTAKAMEGRSKYAVDLNAKDWTRLFRAPLVTRDGVEEFGYQVRLLHGQFLNLANFRVGVPKPRRVYAANSRYVGVDTRLKSLVESLSEGSRNIGVFKAAAHVLSKYVPDDAEKLLARVESAAAAAGLSEREVDQTIRSARSRVQRQKTLTQGASL